MDGELISRDEVEALLFTLFDVSRTLARIEQLLRGDDGEEADEG